jgi:hypothetical protein
MPLELSKHTKKKQKRVCRKLLPRGKTAREQFLPPVARLFVRLAIPDQFYKKID